MARLFASSTVSLIAASAHHDRARRDQADDEGGDRRGKKDSMTMIQGNALSSTNVQ